MKNGILSFLLVIAMLLPMFNITAMAASEPTITSHKNGKSYAPDDFYIKWKSVDGANRYRLAVKSLNDGSYAADIWWDDKLTKTKYECDEDDIKPGHRYKIWVAACGSSHDDVLSQYSIEVIAEDECEHDDYENEVDDIEYDQISGDDTYHYATEYYDRVCNDCGETIKKNIEGDTEKEKHSFSGDKCKKCGYTKKTQEKPSISSASVSPTSGIVNDTKFYFTVKTNADTTDILVESFDGWEITSNYLKDLKSSTSGSTKTWTFWLQMNNVNSSYVKIYALNDDGDESSAKKVSFSLSDGVCQHKKYDEYLDDTDYEQISGDDTYHYVTEYYERVCDDCGETIKKNIEGDTEKEKHNFSGDKCKNCGYTKKAQPTKPSISSASVSPTSGVVNDTKFYFTVKTNKDTTDLLVVSQDGWDITSNYLKDLKSTTSGDTKTWTFWLQMNNVNSSYVNIYALNDDGDESSAKKVSFSLTTGVCPHKNYDEYLDDTDYESISGDDTYHYVTEYYERVCDDCGETIKKNIEGNSTKEKHNFSGNKCKKCGYTIKTESKPSINSASVSPTSGVVNDTKFKFTVKTNVETTDILVKSFDGWDITSDYLKDLKCSTSGSTKTWTFWLQMNNVNSSYVNVYALNDNGNMSSAKKVSFSLNKGVCKHTSYDEYLEDTDYEPISGDDTYHYIIEYNKRVCEDCNTTIKNNIKGSSKEEKHSFSGDKCRDCGYTKKSQSKPSISSASVSPTSGTLNDTKFKFTVKTNKDTTDLLVRAFNGYEITSDYLNDLKCSTSGSTKTWTFWLKINNLDSKYINIYAINDNGDESSAKKVNFTVKEAVVKDTTKPQVTKLECENGETFTQTSGYVTFNAKASDNIGVSKIELYLGNSKLGTENGGSVGFAIPGSKFKVGKNTISAYAYDDAGNKSSAKTITLNVKEQQTISKPSINSASVSPTKGTLNETKFKFTVKTNKDTTDLLVRAFNGYEITSDYLNDLKCSTSGSTKTWTFWLKINNINSSYVNVYALNDDGEESSAKKVSFTVSEKKDTTKPQVTKLECENGTTFSQTNGYVTFNVKATDNIGVSKIELYCGSKKLSENDSDSMGAAVLFREFAVGQNTITAYAYDKAGNKSSAKTIKITIKAVEGKGTPTINSASVSPTKGTLNETQFKFTVKTNKEATDLLVRAFNGYEITSDKLNDLKCTTSGNTKTWTFWLKINNINSSYVNVYALNDNDDESGAKKVSFTVSEPPKKDETAPVIGDITSSAGSTFKKGTSTKITVTVTDENLSGAVLYVDNKKIKNFTSGKISSTLPSLAIGNHNVTIKAKDKAGNTAEKSITLTVTDPKAVIPTVEVLSASNVTATSATLQGKVTSNSGVKIKKYGFAYDDGTNTQYKWIDGHIDNNKVFTANITGLKPETAYSYQVIAINENDIEGKSNNYMKFTTFEGVAEPEKEADTFVNDNVLILGVNEYEGYHNGQKIKVENSEHTPVPPYISGKRTLIPLRFIAESLGAKKELYGSVNWDENTKTITIYYRNTTAIYKIGSNQFTVKGTIYEDVYNKKVVYSEEGMTFTDSAAPKIENGNTYIPLRLMCEKVFGMKVEYIENGSVIVIFPRENYTFEQNSYYSGLIEKVRHTHKYNSNGNGKHSCSICGKTQTCSGNPCSVCKYSKPVTQPTDSNKTTLTINNPFGKKPNISKTIEFESGVFGDAYEICDALNFNCEYGNNPYKDKVIIKIDQWQEFIIDMTKFSVGTTETFSMTKNDGTIHYVLAYLDADRTILLSVEGLKPMIDTHYDLSGSKGNYTILERNTSNTPTPSTNEIEKNEELPTLNLHSNSYKFIYAKVAAAKNSSAHGTKYMIQESDTSNANWSKGLASGSQSRYIIVDKSLGITDIALYVMDNNGTIYPIDQLASLTGAAVDIKLGNASGFDKYKYIPTTSNYLNLNAIKEDCNIELIVNGKSQDTITLHNWVMPTFTCSIYDYDVRATVPAAHGSYDWYSTATLKCDITWGKNFGKIQCYEYGWIVSRDDLSTPFNPDDPYEYVDVHYPSAANKSCDKYKTSKESVSLGHADWGAGARFYVVTSRGVFFSNSISAYNPYLELIREVEHDKVTSDIRNSYNDSRYTIIRKKGLMGNPLIAAEIEAIKIGRPGIEAMVKEYSKPNIGIVQFLAAGAWATFDSINSITEIPKSIIANKSEFLSEAINICEMYGGVETFAKCLADKSELAKFIAKEALPYVAEGILD